MKIIKILIVILALTNINQTFAQRVLTLNECKQSALQNNMESKNSKLKISASHRIKQSAFTNYFPSVSGGGLIFESQKGLMEIENKGGNLPVYDGNPANIGKATQYAYFPSSTIEAMKNGRTAFINAVQPIYAGGRIRNGNKLAELGEDVSILKDKMTSDEIVIKTEEQYWQIVSLQEKARTVIKYEELLSRLLLQVEDAFRSGVVMKNDVLKVKLKLSEIQLNKSKLENGINLATMAFCQHIGIPYDTSLELKDELAINETPENIFVDKNDAVKLRTEYALLEKSIEAEKLQTKMKRGEFLPQIGVGASAVYMQFDQGKDRTLGMVFATVSVPISSWWSGGHELAERQIHEEIADNNFKNTTELLLLQIEKTKIDLINAYKQYQLSVESKAQAEENFKVNEDSYKNGLTNVSDLLEAQALLQQTNDQLTDAIANYTIKKSTYLQAVGK